MSIDDLYLVLLACLHVGATAVFCGRMGRTRAARAPLSPQAQPRAFIGTRRAAAPAPHPRRAATDPDLDHDHATLARSRRLARRERLLSRRRRERRRGTRHLHHRQHRRHQGRRAILHGFLVGAARGAGRASRPDRERRRLPPTLPVFVLITISPCGVTSVIPDFDRGGPPRSVPETIVRQIDSSTSPPPAAPPPSTSGSLRWCRDHGRPLRVRNLFTGGAPVLPPLARLLADPKAFTGEAHVVAYGSSEAEPIASIAVREMLAAMASVAGRPAPDGICAGRPVLQIELRIIRACDDPMCARAVGPRRMGRRARRGRRDGGERRPRPRRLLERPRVRASQQEFARAIAVWHRTGDGARLDAEGRLWLMGRCEASASSARDGCGGAARPSCARVRAAGREPCRVFRGDSIPRAGNVRCCRVEMTGGPSTAPDIERVRAALDPIRSMSCTRCVTSARRPTSRVEDRRGSVTGDGVPAGR